MAEIYVKVETDQNVFKIENGEIMKLQLTEKPENGRANAEMIRELSNILDKEIGIIEGHQRPRKKIKVDLTKEEVEEKVKQWQRQR